MDEKNIGKIIEFISALTDVENHFCECTLKIFEKVLGMDRLVFCCRDDDNSWRKKPGFDLIGRNIDIIFIRRFAARYYHDDIFLPINLPAEKRGRRLLTIGDLIDWKDYESSTYGQFMSEIGLYYQACLYLYHDEDWIGHISIFRSREEGDFTAEELEIFHAIGECVEKLYYRQHLKMNTMINDFHWQYDGMNLGAALLNHDLSIIAMNDTLPDYVRYIFENGNIDIRKVSSGDIYATEDLFQAQRLIDYFGSNIITKPEKIWIDCIRYNFQINTKQLFIKSASGKTKSFYLFLMARFTKIQSMEALQFLDELTPREVEVLTLILAGADNKETAEHLHVSIHTVKTHLEHIYRKFLVTNKAELFAALYGGTIRKKKNRR